MEYKNKETGFYETIKGKDGAAAVSLEDGSVIVPTEIQSRYATTIQTHTNVAVAPSGTENYGSWIDTDGYDKISVTCTTGGGGMTSTWLHWSHDATNIHGSEPATASTTGAFSAPVTKEKVARYVRSVAKNDHTAPMTMTTWLTLKA